MPARSTSRHRTIPVNVVVERRPKTRPAAAPAAPPAPVTLQPSTPAKALNLYHRQRMMWMIVGVGTLVIIFGWVSIFSAQLRGNTPTFFNDVEKMVRDVKWPWEPKTTTPQEQEIRQLEEQVFPQFQ